MSWRGVAGGLLALVVAVVCIRLGFWQLDRLEQRRERNAAYAAALALEPVVLDDAGAERLTTDPLQFVYRRATFDEPPLAMFIWRGRSLGGRPGVNVLTARDLGGDIVLVNEGWVPSRDGTHPEPSRIDVNPGAARGVLIPLIHAPERAIPLRIAVGRDSVLTFQVPDSAALASALARPLLPLYLQREGAATGSVITPLPLPDLADEGPHFSYAVQWFSFAAIAIIGFGSAAYLKTRSRAG